jgi:hypothetical protein|tara:strand:+ start:7305 stop:7664 length:360 start_codon:yes stop_codon:yes gene_type:complete
MNTELTTNDFKIIWRGIRNPNRKSYTHDSVNYDERDASIDKFRVPTIVTCQDCDTTMRANISKRDRVYCGNHQMQRSIKRNQLIAEQSDNMCDERCLNARGHKCSCSCGGGNHGMFWNF